jgi:hypothetical protein
MIPIIQEEMGTTARRCRSAQARPKRPETAPGAYRLLGYSQIMGRRISESRGLTCCCRATCFTSSPESGWQIDRLAETRLKGTGIRCFVTGGNDDDPEVLDVMQGAGRESFFACEGQVVQVDDLHSMASVGFSNPTPWKTPREIPDELGASLRMCAQSGFRTVLQFHVPPQIHPGLLPARLSTDPPPRERGTDRLPARAARPCATPSSHQPCGLHGHIQNSCCRSGDRSIPEVSTVKGLRGCLVTSQMERLKAIR